MSFLRKQDLVKKLSNYFYSFRGFSEELAFCSSVALDCLEYLKSYEVIV